MKKMVSVLLALVCLLAFGQVSLAEETDAFLAQIAGTYVELFPEMAKEEYHQAWIDDVTPYVGAENAEDTVAYLLNVCMGSLYGQEAIDKFTADPEAMQFNCYFLGGVKKMTVDGNVISGVDENGNQVFSHSYTAMNLDNENGFLFYQSDDADAGQFSYFAFSPDTMADTYHLEFRYAEKLEDLQSWFEGDYAYWNVGAIAEDYTQEQILSAINLFATENTAGEEEDEAA
ncbi:MAG: hypothetical protein MRZ98_08095 [Clostridiales bacterium]|nr:hypothetical protein [Clostridiales bacterium]